MKQLLVHKKSILLGLILLLLVAALVCSGYFYVQYQKAQAMLDNPTQAARKEVESLIARVGTHIVLPAEEPTVATVSDTAKLAGQAFFAKAQRGDKVLIYPQAKKAILYRPSTDKLIEVAPVSVNGAGEAVAGAATTIRTGLTVALYNGTSTVGLANTYEKQLQSVPALAEKITITSKQNAAKKDYTKTMVIPVKEGSKADAQALATLLGVSVGSLPAGETTPDADILIILGQKIL